MMKNMRSDYWQCQTTAADGRSNRNLTTGRRATAKKRKKMPLTVSEIREKLAKPQNRNRLTLAIEQEHRLRFHSENRLSQADAGRAATLFLNWVRTLIPGDKFRMFCALFRYPVKTNELTEQIFAQLEKVFDGQDPRYDYEFASDEMLEDWNDYKKSSLKDPVIWREDGFEAMKCQINSLIVVDQPEVQTGERPDPYFYWLDVSSVIDFESNENNGFEWIFFKTGPDNLAAFDDGFYRTFSYKDGEIGEMLTENAHELGYCPVRWFWTASISKDHKEVKKSPLTPQLSDLDKYLFDAISCDYTNLYASYPIMSGFMEDCDYEDDVGRHCKDGYMCNQNGLYLLDMSGALTECPKCGNSKLTGPGTFITFPPPGPENDKADLRNPVQITTVDRAILDYNQERLSGDWMKIYQSATGYGGEPVNDQAVNEKQIIASFESRKSVLKNLKKNFEAAHEWTMETVCRLRYGSMFLGATIDYGTEFYLYAPDEILEAYNKAKEIGADDNALDALQDQYNQTKYRNNPNARKRANIIKNLDPFRHLGKKEVKEMYLAGLIPYPDYMLKTNLSTLITRFERENTTLVRFGELLEFDKKIKRIKEVLTGYIQQPKMQNNGQRN